MRMSNHVGMYKSQDELTFFDYLSFNNIDTPYDTFTWVDVPVLNPDAKIVVNINPVVYRSAFGVIAKYGVSGTNYKRGIAIKTDYYNQVNFGALDGLYAPKVVGNPVPVNSWNEIQAVFNDQTVLITVGGVQYTVEGLVQTFVDGGDTWKLFGGSEQRSGQMQIAIKDVKFYDLEDNLLSDLVPCVKNPGRYIGMYDQENLAFYAAYHNGIMQTTKSTIFSVGNLT